MPRGRPRLVQPQIATVASDESVADHLAAEKAKGLHLIEATVADDLHLGDGRVIYDGERAHVTGDVADDLIRQRKARRL